MHPGGLLVLSNLGLHLTASKPRQDVERSHNIELIRGTMHSALGSVIVWLHHGYCGNDGTRNGKLDCAHYCFNAPQIWMPIWQNLVDIVVGLGNKTFEDRKSESIIHDPSKCQLISELDDRRNIYCVEFGLRRLVSEKFFNTELPVAFTTSLAKNVSLEEFVGIPIGIPLLTASFPNASLVRPIVGRDILLVNATYRHLIPDFDTLQCLQRLGFAKGDIRVIWEIDLLKLHYGVPLAPMKCF